MRLIKSSVEGMLSLRVLKQEMMQKSKENGILEAKESAIIYMNGCSLAEENEA